MKKVERFLYKETVHSAGALLLILGLMLLVVGFEVLAPWPFKILIDNVLGTEPPTTNPFVRFIYQYFRSPEALGYFAVFLYFISTFAVALADYVKSTVTKASIRRLTGRFSKAAFGNLEGMSIGFYSRQKIGDYIYRLGYDVSAFGELLEEGVLPIITSAIYLITTTTIMFFIDVPLTFMALTALPFLAYGLHFFNLRVNAATKRSETLSSAAFSFLEESLTHLKVVQSFSQEDRQLKGYSRKIDVSLRSDLALHKLDYLLAFFVSIIIAVSYSAVMLYGIHAVFAGALTTGLLIVFIFYLDNLTSPVLSLIYASTATHVALTRISRMEEFFNPLRQLDRSGTIRDVPTADIIFENVTLEGAEGKVMLKNLSFTIPAGKRTIIFGGSGSGKTSVVNLLMRFVERPTAGRILIGATPIEEYDLDALRAAITYVPQEIVLFDETIRRNILFGTARATPRELSTAVRLSDSAEFIRKLPGGLDFHVGEHGGNLSGGQRQRIMLARAFMKRRANIAVFDESFSALDVKTRRQVLRNMRAFAEDKTAIIISNIFDVIHPADHVIVLNQGSLLFSGSAHRLPKELSLYNMILDNQQQDDPENA